MNKPDISVTTLLERLEGELQTANGRTARVCRDPNGNYWVVDDAERVVPLSEFASECAVAARAFGARARAEEMRRLVTAVKEAVARVAKSLRARPARA